MRKRCPHCGGCIVIGRGGIHERRECISVWYLRERGKHPRKVAGRPKQPDDLSAEQIERIMARVAAQQRYNRQRVS